MLKQFLADIHIPGTLIQIGGVNTVDITNETKGLDEYLAQNKTKDIYFLANVDKQSPMRSKKEKDEKNPNKDLIKYPNKDRASDCDIIQKKYVYFDFDVYKEYEKNGVLLTPEDIKQKALECIDKLKDTEFCDLSYLIYSGGGFHLYFICDALAMSKGHYSIGYEAVSNQLSDLLGLEHDKSCKNPARIARLPGSYNNKKDRSFSPVLVEILKHQNCKSNLLQKILDTGKQLKEEQDNQQIENEIRIDSLNYDKEGTYQAINKIPIQNEILCLFTSWRLEKNKNFRTPTGNLSASYISTKYPNVLILDESREFKHLNKKSLSTFSFVKEMHKLSNADTFKYFEDKYNEIKDLATKIRIDWAKDNEKNKITEILNNKQIKTIDPIDNINHNPFTWGTEKLDKVITPIEKHHFIIFAGKQNSGKTAFTFDMAMKNAVLGHKVLYISLEMNTANIVIRIARDYAGITKELWRKPQDIPDKQRQAYKKRQEEILSIKTLNAV